MRLTPDFVSLNPGYACCDTSTRLGRRAVLPDDGGAALLGRSPLALKSLEGGPHLAGKMQTFDRANLGKSCEPYGEALDLGLRALAGLWFRDFFHGVNLAHLNGRRSK